MESHSKSAQAVRKIAHTCVHVLAYCYCTPYVDRVLIHTRATQYVRIRAALVLYVLYPHCNCAASCWRGSYGLRLSESQGAENLAWPCDGDLLLHDAYYVV